ncbi:PH domain-containing protein [Allonocardiopsis opalescens]|uniref:PH (Pleckstrin Homology) domain-containing protein n=1 Tax=Allonocardiopsis opalescens TaxID=1144618 RepID=A0A2T0Q3X6_9ACTN|nr:PH domain-containing protein [Allonocardiopsis opalescens]PRX98443.1 PH (Pleckstrin Homology) domain-containing protein [Allonocardiopsis opalescens]
MTAPIQPPTLPVVWRPRRARTVPRAMAVVVNIATIGLAAALPGSWMLSDRLMMIALGVLIGAGLLFLTRPKIVGEEHRLIVVNIVRTRVLDWAEIVHISMREGEPWPTLDLADGSTLAAMGIQSSDGDHALRQLTELRAAVTAKGEAGEPDGA